MLALIIALQLANVATPSRRRAQDAVATVIALQLPTLARPFATQDAGRRTLEVTAHRKYLVRRYLIRQLSGKMANQRDCAVKSFLQISQMHRFIFGMRGAGGIFDAEQ